MNKKGKRVLSILLTFVMLLGIFPIQAMAAEDGGPDVYASDPADPSSGTPGQTPAGDNQPGGDDPDENQGGTSGEDEAGKNPSGEGTPAPGSDGILNPTGPEGRVNAPAPGSDGGSDDGADDNDWPGDDTPDDETKPEDKVWKAAIVGGRLELTFGKDDEYTLKSFHKVFPDNADIRARFWRENEENRYRSWIAELRGTENRVLALSMRDGKGDDKVYAFDNLVEFYLTCKDWEGKTLSEMNERQFALYLLNSDGELGTAQTLFQVMDGAPALFFSTNMLADLLLNEPTQEEKDRRKQEAEEEAARLAELAKQQEEEEKKNAETIDDDSGDENKNEQITDNTNLENNEKLKEEKKEDLEEEEKEEEQEQEEEKEEKEKLKEETKEEEPVIYIPQEQTLGDTTVTAQVLEGSLNEYAHLSLTSFNSEMTEAFKSAILTTVNAGVEEQPDENEQSDEEAAGEDGQASAAKKQEIASIILMDISFQAGENNYTPEKLVILTIQDDAIKSMTAPRVYHYAGGLAEDLTESATIDKEAGTVTFPASAFSPYAVADLADEGSVKAEKEEQEKEEEKQPAREEEQLDDQDAVDVSNHPLVEVEASDYEPLLDWFQLSPQSQALLGMGPQAPQNPGRKMLKAAPRLNAAASEGDQSEGDGQTIEKISIKWLSYSTGADEPAGQGTLALETDTNKVDNQQFQIDFALSGKDDYAPGAVELVFPAYIWLDRYGKEPGNLTLSVPEEPGEGADFAWRRVDDKIIITNVHRISAASKVMIQATFRNVPAQDMVDKDVAEGSPYYNAEYTGTSRDLYATITVQTGEESFISLTSNTINATIDTHVEAASATKSARNNSTREYYVYHTPEAAKAAGIPQEFLDALGNEAVQKEYSFARWYVSGSATGSQPFTMTVNDTFDDTVIHYKDALHEDVEILHVDGRMLGVQGALVKSGEGYVTGDVLSENGTDVSAVLYDGYNTLPKSASVWTAYKKSGFPKEGDEYRITNKQVTKVTGWDDLITTTKEASAEAPFRLPVVYTIKKVWDDEGNETKRPMHQSFGRYYDENLYTLETVTIRPEDKTDDDAWTISWDDAGQGWQYKIREYGMYGNGWEEGHDGSAEGDDAFLKDGTDITGRYHFMNIPDEEYSHIINRVYDEDGDLREYDRWWYSLEKEEYDSKTHTWITTNKYNQEHVVRALVPFKEQQLEVAIRKNRINYGNSNLMSTSDRALNILRRGDDVTLDYDVYGRGYIIDLTKNVDIENLKITDFGFKDVTLELEDNYGADTHKTTTDNTLLLDSSIRLTQQDAEIAYVYLYTPSYLHYYQPDKYSAWTFTTLSASDFGNYKRPDMKLMGCDYGTNGNDGTWVTYATLSFNEAGNVVITPENGATVSGSRVSLPAGVWKVKTVMTVPGLNKPGMTEEEAKAYLKSRIDGVSMEYRIGVKLKASSETIQERLEALFNANDYAMCTLDNYATINVYEKGGGVATSLDDQSRSWLHGRNHRVAVRQEKSFELTENDLNKKELKLHSKVNMTQQSNVLESNEYWDAREEGLIPSTESGTWYDLLPVGVRPDLSTVKLSGGQDKIIDAYIIPNYRDTGRSMLVVKAEVTPHVSYTNSYDYNPYPNDITYPKEGYKDVHTLEFDSYYSWDEARLYGLLGKIRNVAAYEADENALGNIPGWSGEPDDPQKNNNQRAMDAVGNDKLLMTGLDPARPEGHSAFVYSGAVLFGEKPDFQATTMLYKYVTRDGLGVWTTGREGATQATVYEGDNYSYMLYVEDDDNPTTNIIFIDTLENYVPKEKDDDYGSGTWQGNFVGVDTAGLREVGVAPVIWYYVDPTGGSARPMLPFGGGSGTHGKDTTDDPNLIINYLESTAGWSTTAPTDPAKVTAIAVDARKDTKGENFILPKEKHMHFIIQMRAKVYDTLGGASDPFNADQDLRQDPANNDYAFNNIYMGCTQLVPGEQTHAIIHHDYVRVGILPHELTVNKKWNDSNNNDGKRPGKITVTLMANGAPATDADGKLIPAATLSAETGWTGMFAHVPQYDKDGNRISYTYKEESAEAGLTLEGYTQSVSRDGNTVTLTNTLIPEKTKVSFTKEWKDDDQSAETLKYRPESIIVRLYSAIGDAEPTFTGKTVTVKPDAQGNWSGSFTGLPKYTNPTGITGEQKEIKYTVQEEPIYRYIDQYGTPGETEAGRSIAITNQFHPFGDLRISKSVVNTTAISEDKEFTFTLLLKDSEGNDDTGTYDFTTSTGASGTISNGGTFKLKGSENITILDIPAEFTYEVVENETPGFTLTNASGSSGIIRAGKTVETHNEHQASFTNRYNAAGSQTVMLHKTLDGRVMSQYQFRFELVDMTEGSPTQGEVLRTSSATAAGLATFSRLSYTEADHGKTFTYQIREVDREMPGYTYDKNTFTVKVAVKDNGDGTMTCTPRYFKADGTEITDKVEDDTIVIPAVDQVVFHNEYHAKGSISLRAWKQLPDGELSDYGPFAFELIGKDRDSESATYDQFITLQTKPNNEAGTITFDDLNFTEKDVGKSFLYVVREVQGKVVQSVADDGTITYKEDKRIEYAENLRGIELSIADNGNGTLAVTQTNVTVTESTDETGNKTYTKGSETTELPIFVNHLVPGDISVTKLTKWDKEKTDEPDGDMEFPFSLTLVGNELPAEITVVLSELPEGDSRQQAYTEKPPTPLTGDEKLPKNVQLKITSPEGLTLNEGETVYRSPDGTPVTGVYEFTLKAGQTLTVKDLPAGVAYQFQEAIPSGWTLEFENVAGAVKPEDTQRAVYTNTYEPGKAVATVIATKRLDGQTPAAQMFAFELVDDNKDTDDYGKVLQTLWNHASGYVLFDLEFVKPGTYHYLIREVQKQIKSVTFDEDGKATITYSDDNRTIAFDETVYPVTVYVEKEVAEDGASETLTATVYYASEVPGEGSEPDAGKTPPQFKNTTRPGSLQISKVGKGLTEANKNAEFTFKVTLSNDAGMPLTESGNMFWYAEESEEKTTPAPIPPQPDQPENLEPKEVNAPSAPSAAGH